MIGLVSLVLGGGARRCREKAGLLSNFTSSLTSIHGCKLDEVCVLLLGWIFSCFSVSFYLFLFLFFFACVYPFPCFFEACADEPKFKFDV